MSGKLPMSKGKRGPADTASARKPGSIARKPKGLGKSTHPFAKGTGTAGPGASRVLKGVDKSKGAKGKVVSDKANKLDGKYF